LDVADGIIEVEHLRRLLQYCSQICDALHRRSRTNGAHAVCVRKVGWRALTPSASMDGDASVFCVMRSMYMHRGCDVDRVR
jgi:phage host-nuclease inhibitor protein Gam